MRTIYIDSDCKCHIVNDGSMKEVRTDLFDGKCNTFVEGHRLVPATETWTREDGVEFTGEMKSPWQPLSVLEAAQAQYEKDMSELSAAYREGVDSV